MGYKEIKMHEAVNLAVADVNVQTYMLIPVTAQTTIADLSEAKGFVMETFETEVAPVAEEKPEKPERPKATRRSEIDHGKIVALYNAGWPTTKIADEVGCSIQTVINHLKEEGIYKAKGERNNGAED